MIIIYQASESEDEEVEIEGIECRASSMAKSVGFEPIRDQNRKSFGKIEIGDAGLNLNFIFASPTFIL